MRKTIDPGVQNTFSNFARNRAGEPFYVKLVIKEGNGSQESFQPKQEKKEQVTLFALEREKTDTHSNAWAPCTGV